MAIACNCCNLYMNTFVSSPLSGFSPFALVFVHKSPDLLILSFPLLEQFTNTHKDHLQLLKVKAEFTVDLLLDYKPQQAKDRVLNASMYQKVKPFFRRSFGVSINTTHIIPPDRNNLSLTRVFRSFGYQYSVRFQTLNLRDLENRVL